MADSNGSEQIPHWVEWLKYIFGFFATLFAYLWRRQVARVDKIDEAISKMQATAITKEELTEAMNSVRHGLDSVVTELRHQSDRIDRIYLQRGRNDGSDK